MKKNIVLSVVLFSLYFISCGNKDTPAIEDALQREWTISNMISPVGAIDCNVFSVKVYKIEGDTVFVSYKLKSKYSSGNKIFVEFTGAKLIKDSTGYYKVLSTGY